MIDKAKKVCAQYYKDKCFECPLHDICTKNYPLTRENVEKWEKELEAKAQEILSEVH